MVKVGDEIDGYCTRCKLNTYQIVSATDGREVFSVTCRTCRYTGALHSEMSLEEVRSKQIKKLTGMTRKRTGTSNPAVVNFASRKNGDKNDLAAPLKAFREMMGRDPDMGPPTSGGPIREEVLPPPPATANDSPLVRWQRQTATLSARDGRPYNATRTYKAGDVLLHKQHGLGIAETVLHEQAVMVLFRDVETVLQMGISAQFLQK